MSKNLRFDLIVINLQKYIMYNVHAIQNKIIYQNYVLWEFEDIIDPAVYYIVINCK